MRPPPWPSVSCTSAICCRCLESRSPTAGAAVRGTTEPGGICRFRATEGQRQEDRSDRPDVRSPHRSARDRLGRASGIGSATASAAIRQRSDRKTCSVGAPRVADASRAKAARESLASDTRRVSTPLCVSRRRPAIWVRTGTTGSVETLPSWPRSEAVAPRPSTLWAMATHWAATGML